MQKLRSGRTLSSLLAVLMLSTACEKVSGSALPDLKEYSREFQAKAADELEAMPPACPFNTLVPGCSPLHTLIDDCKHSRDQTRAIPGS